MAPLTASSRGPDPPAPSSFLVPRSSFLTGEGGGKAELVGVLNVNKPSGWTSHDVVARMRRISGQRRVGHAGTLDPAAQGVLPVLLGRATRLSDLVGEGQKGYHAWITLGAATSTDDAEGPVTAEAPVPLLSRDVVERALQAFRGTTSQVPPAFSARKVDGQRAYARARRGEHVELQPRSITVYALELLGIDGATIEVDVTCSRGTYVRALARDFAVALGTVGHLTRLIRTRVGSLLLADALTPDEIATRGVEAVMLPPDAVLQDLPAISPAAADVEALLHGRPVACDLAPAPAVRVHEHGRMVLLASTDGAELRSRLVLAPRAEHGAA